MIPFQNVWYFFLFLIIGNDVIFLDPHTTQSSGTVNEKKTEQERKIDGTYHCQYASRLHILQMDPSVAVVRVKQPANLGFYFCV